MPERDEREQVIALMLLLAESEHAIGAAVDGWADGGAWDTAAGLIVDTLKTGYTEAHRLGRALAGDSSIAPGTDSAAAAVVWERESAYWDRLDRDVREGVYDERSEALKRRAQSYVRRFRMVAYAGWVAAHPAGTLFAWELGIPETVHCERCPEISAAGPYTIDTLPTLPGSDDLPCQSNCYCRLSANGIPGF